MELFRARRWTWYDIGLLKWSCLLFGVVVGGLFADFVQAHVGLLLAAAVALAIRPAVAYFRG